MAMNFPDNPAINQEYTNEVGRTWIWTGSTWKSKSVDFNLYIADTTNVHGISDTSLLVYQEDLADYAPVVSPTFLGAVTLPENTSIGFVDPDEISYLSGLNSSVQGQLNSKANSSHTHSIDDIDGVSVTELEINSLSGISVSSIELNSLSGITSNVQSQIDNHTHTLADITDFTLSSVELNILDGATISTAELNYLDGATSNIQSQIDGKANSIHTHTLGSITDVSVSTSEVAHLSGVTSNIQTQINGKANEVHGHQISDISDITASASEINVLDGITATTTELNYTDGVTSSIQDQLNSKANISGATFTGDLEIPNVVITGNLLVQGTTTTINTTDYAIRDNMLYMNQAGLFAITNAVGNGTTVTYTAPNHDFQAGDYIVVTDVTPSVYNIAGTSLLTIDSVNGDDFVVTKSDTGAYVSGGTARGKSAANPDLGFAAGRTTATGYAHTGLFRDASDATYKLFDGYTPEPDESLYIDTAHASFALAPLAISALTTGNITATGTVNLSSATLSGVSLDKLDNVTETSPGSSDVLFYDGSQWINRYINAIPSKLSVPTLTSANYDLQASDAGMILEISSSSSSTVTIPSAETFPIGTQIMIIQAGSGQVTVNVQNSGTQTLDKTPGNKLRAQWSVATLLKRNTNAWLLYGDLSA